MLNYKVTEDEEFLADMISEQMFGTNFVTHYDIEFPKDNRAIEVLNSLGTTVLRYPGGSVTENEFTEAAFLTGEWEAESYSNGTGQFPLTPMRSFFSVASQIGANVQLVIPTRVAFEESIGVALSNGSFGARSQLRADYLELVARYLDYAMSIGQELGVTISQVEIGNEFWGSGQMSAFEYGYIAGKVALFVGAKYPGVAVSAQIVGSANLYSPVDDRQVFLEETISGDYQVHFPEDYTGSVPDEWKTGVIPGQGNAVSQARAIAAGILETEGAANHISSAISHAYFNGGFLQIDGEKDFALRTAFDVFLEALGSPELDHSVTEWSPRNRGSSYGNADGLQYAHTVVEAFFELTSNGVDTANFWPTTFGKPNLLHRTLIDSVDLSLTFGGVAFNWLTRTQGTKALFDFEVPGEIDIHGYGGESRTVIFLSERGFAGSLPSMKREIEIDLSEFLPEGDYFVLVSRMTSKNGDVTDNGARPDVVDEGGYVSTGQMFKFELEAWELAVVEILNITSDADVLFGGLASDTINGEEGNDRLFGGYGNDFIKGQIGNDYVSGENGKDALYGGWGNDTILGGPGEDFVSGGSEADIISGDLGNDSLHGDAGNDTIDGGAGNDYVSGGLGDDRIVAGFGSDTIDGGDGSDAVGFSGVLVGILVDLLAGRSVVASDVSMLVSIEGAEGTEFADMLIGNSVSNHLQGAGGNDTIHGGDGSDILDGGTGDDFLFGGGSDIDLRDVVFGNDGNDFIDGGHGNDELHGGAGNDTLIGNHGADTLVGNEGNDSLIGSPGSDALFGGSGDDTLNGGFGVDRLNGGSGADAFFHLGIWDHGSDWIQDYSFVDGDTLMLGLTGAVVDDFQVNFSFTQGAGSDESAEAFVINRPTGQILWALIDGSDQAGVLLGIGGRTFDLLD